MNKKLLFCFLFLISQLSFAQLVPRIEWLKIYDGIGTGNDFVYDMGIDKSYNIYLAGRSEGADGTPDFLIMKYSNTGDSLLNIRFISSQNAWDEANSIAVDSNENIYAIGSASFGQSSFYSVFFKYLPNGNVIWDKNYFSNSDSVSEGLKVVLDNQENPIIGYLKYQHNSSINFTKYKSNGDSLWTTQIKDDTSGYQLNYLLADKFGNIYAALTQSYYNGGDVPETRIILLKLNQKGSVVWYKSMQGDSPRKLLFDNDSNILLETHGDGRVLKYTSNGDSLWNYESNGLFTDIAVDKDNNVLVCGYTGGIGSFDYLIDKISPEGDEIWSKTFNSNENLRDFASSIVIDKENNIYVTGSSNDMVSQGLCYTLKYNSAGELKWLLRFDAPHSIFENPHSIFIDDSNNVIIGGDFTDSTDGSNIFVMKIKQILGTGVQQSSGNLPSQYFLSQNYPNPFNPNTKIKFSIPESGNVKFEIFDVLGRKVKELINQYLSIGSYIVNFDASNLSSGIYYYRLSINNFIQMKKAVLLK
jgi:Secretion system C-terminal sorting domain/Beta-propeller repeat